MPDDLRRQAVTHASWTERRPESYERLAFLGDSVLALAITAHLFPHLDEERFPPGRLTKIRAQTVSGRSCKEVATRLGLPERMKDEAPETGAGLSVDALLQTERVVAEMIEAVIGGCYLTYGYERTAAAVVEAFAPEMEEALANPGDFKSELQERLARRGGSIAYEVREERGPPHDRTFEVAALVDGEEAGRGTGRSKKEAEQEAAGEVLQSFES